MELALYGAAYLIVSFCVCCLLGNAAKNHRAASMGVSIEEDTRLQDKAQLHYLRTGESINVVD